MKHLFTFIIIFACILSVKAEITSVSEALTAHREWMTANTPKPSELSDEELMMRSFEIIDLRLKETEAYRILAAAARKVPEVEEYLNWEASMQCDDHLRIRRNAIRGMRDYISKQNPECYAARRLHLEWIKYEAVFADMMKEYDTMISHQTEVCKKASAKEKKHEDSLLLLMKMARYDHRSSLELTDNPAHYPELWDIEEQVVKLYPINSTDTIADRMDLYNQLAPLKGQPTEYSDVVMMFPDGYEPFFTDPDMKYEYTGTFRDYLCNTGFLYEKALEISEKLYGEFHPNSIDINYSIARFRLYNMTYTPEISSHVKSVCDYMLLYYPSHSLEVRYSELLQMYSDYLSTGVFAALSKADEVENDIKTYYGDTQFYLNALSSLTSLRLHSGADINTVLLKYENACNHIASDTLKEAMWKLYPYSETIFLDAKMVTGKMLSLKDIYMNNHNGSAVSVHLGQQLIYYFRYTALDFTSLLEVANTYTEDIKNHYGSGTAPHFLAILDSILMSTLNNTTDNIQLIDDVINLAEQSDFTASKYTRRMLYDAKAEYYWSNSQHSKCHDCYAKLHDDKLIEDNVPYLIRDAVSLAYLEGISPKTDAYINFCKETLETSELGILDAEYFIEFAEYYQIANMNEDAICMYEKALEIHNYQTSYALDDEYFAIVNKLSEMYERTNNINALSRLSLSDRENLNSMISIVPSYTMIDYLMNQYYIFLRRKDYNSAYFYIEWASKMVNSIISTSQNDKALQYTIAPSVIQACITLFSKLYDDLMDTVKSSTQNEDFSDYSAYLNKTMDDYIKGMPDLREIRDILLDLKDSFPEYDSNYKYNTNYITILFTLAEYYKFYEKDYTTAEKYLLECGELYINPFDKKNIYFSLANLMQKTGDENKHKYYTNLAYDLIEQNPEMMDEADRVSIVGYRFNQAMESGQNDLALEKARDFYTLLRKMLDNSFQLMTSQDQDVIFTRYGDPAWALASVLEKKPEEISAETYDAIVYRTGMQLRSQQELRHLISTTSDPEIKSVADSISRMRTEQKTLVITPDLINTEKGNAIGQRSSDISFRIELLEQRLLDLTAEMRNSVNPDIPWQKIRDSLSPEEAAIEFVFSYTKIMALLLKPDCASPIAIELCDWKEFSEKLNSLHTKNSASLARKLYGENSSLDLYSMLWQPLESYLDGISTIYFNAPGILHTIAFNALYTPDGSYLIDKYDLRQLTTTAQLTFDKEEVRAPQSAALVGDVLFDPSQKSQIGNLPEESGERNIDEDYSLIAGTADDSRGVARQHFRYLPFTASEISGIKSSFNNNMVSTAMRSEATEEEFRKLCDTKPEVLHIATHGFFLSSEEEAMRVPFMRRYSGAVGSAMQRSGIALANAEATWTGKAELPEEADGILTANEVSQLNLKDTRLVALSACETALGAYNFDGIHGLIRGFKQAGAKSLLVSLWSVNDRSTSLFMKAFYSNWQASGDRHTAYRKAIDEVRASYPSPFYWAPFILLD